MIVRTLLAIAMTTTLLIGGVAAVGAAPPTDGPGTNDPGADAVGPSGGLPAQVPDHVRAVHETIESFLDGGIDRLGGALRDVLPATGTDEVNA